MPGSQPRVIVQGDNEIPTHIVLAVSNEEIRTEEALLKGRKHWKTVRPRRAGTTAAAAELGLTEVKKTRQQQQQQQQRQAKRSQDSESEEEDEDEGEGSAGQVTRMRRQRALLRSSSNEQQSFTEKRPATKRQQRQQANDARETKAQDKFDEEQELGKENEHHAGRTIFGFAQTKGKNVRNMMQKAMLDEAAKDEEEEDQSETENQGQRRRAKRALPEEQKVDHAKRRRIQRQMELSRDDARSEDEDENIQSERDSDDGEAVFEERAAGYERYFQDLHTKSLTSNNTMSRLGTLEPQELKQLLDAAPKKHKHDIATLTSMHKRRFRQWRFELQSGFNLLFYGYGSKRRLLNEFASATLKDGATLIINGFFPSITVKDILHKITYGVMNVGASLGPFQEQVEYICDYFADENRAYDKLYIVVHNIDGANLRNERAQTILSTLAQSPNIYLIASVDQINAALLWDNVKSSRFNWIWHDATTFDDYLVETSYENTLLTSAGEMTGIRGAQFVLRSLTSNGRGVFSILVKEQLDAMEAAKVADHLQGNESYGLSYHQYFQKCRESFFATSDTAMRSQLTEFRDHKLISSKRLGDGTEMFYIPFDKNALQILLEASK